MNKFYLSVLSLSVFFLASCASSQFSQLLKRRHNLPPNQRHYLPASPAIQQAEHDRNMEPGTVTSGRHGSRLYAETGRQQTSGTYKGRFGEAPCTGTVNGTDFVITYELSGSKVVYKGKVDGDKMSGEADLAGQASGNLQVSKPNKFHFFRILSRGLTHESCVGPLHIFN